MQQRRSAEVCWRRSQEGWKQRTVKREDREKWEKGQTGSPSIEHIRLCYSSFVFILIIGWIITFFWVRQMLPLLSILFIMHNKAKHLNAEIQLGLSARLVWIGESGSEQADNPWVGHNLFSLQCLLSLNLAEQTGRLMGIQPPGSKLWIPPGRGSLQSMSCFPAFGVAF